MVARPAVQARRRSAAPTRAQVKSRASVSTRLLHVAILMEQSVEGRYLRAGRALTYGPIRELIESLAAEVRDHERILSRHLQLSAGTRYPLPQVRRLRTDRRRRARATPGAAIVTPPALITAFQEAFHAVRRAARFHRMAAARVDDRYTAKFLEIVAENHDFHLDLMDRILTGLRDGEMHLTPGRKLATIEVPWVRPFLEGVVPPWLVNQYETTPKRRYMMAGL